MEKEPPCRALALDDDQHLENLKTGGQPAIDELIEINLRKKGDPRPIFVSASLSEEE